MPLGGVAVEQKRMWIRKLEKLPSASRADHGVKVKKLELLTVKKCDRRHGMALFHERVAVMEEQCGGRHDIGQCVAEAVARADQR
eukprot:7095756-Heterocapsa_arctica.AAC.1